MYNKYAKPMISYGILAYGCIFCLQKRVFRTQFYFLSIKTHFKNSVFFCLLKRILKTIFFMKRGDHVCYFFKCYNLLSVFVLDALVKKILGQIAKFLLSNFLDVDSTRPNTRASIKSLITLSKNKTQTQKNP